MVPASPQPTLRSSKEGPTQSQLLYFTFTEANSETPILCYDEAAQILTGESLTDEWGSPLPDYSKKLQNNAYREDLEQKLKRAILETDIKSDVTEEIFAAIQPFSPASDLYNSEFYFLASTVAKKYTSLALASFLSAKPSGRLNLSRGRDLAKKDLAKKAQEDQKNLEKFVHSTLLIIPTSRPGERERLAKEIAAKIIWTLQFLEILENKEVILDPYDPVLFVKVWRIEGERGREKFTEEEQTLGVLIYSAEELREKYEASRQQTIILLKAAMAENKVDLAKVLKEMG